MSSTPSDVDESPDRFSSRGLIRALVMAAVIVAVDQVTKQWAVNRLDRAPCSVEGSCIDLFWTLRFRLSFNSGAAFSSFTGGGSVLGVIAIGMSIYLAVLASRSTDSWSPWVFGAIIGGAVGNLTDRVFRADDGVLSGAVVDFIDFQFWPIFNVADIAIVGGVIVLAGRLWWLDRGANAHENPHDPTDATDRTDEDQRQDEQP